MQLNASSDNHTPTQITGPAGSLEILTAGLDTEVKAIAIVCHPHPLHGGTMHNKVVHYVARSLGELGLATIRFNFRGVGNSEGEYGEGAGETEDLLAVIDWVRQHYPGLPVWLAGFSFGGFMAVRAAGLRPIERLITIAPAFNYVNLPPLESPRCPWLLIQGDTDDVVPHDQLRQWVAGLERPPRTLYLKGVGHFFHGRLNDLRQALVTTLAPAASQL